MLFSWFDLVDVVFLAECVEDDVDLIEHVHHLHRCDVDADLIKLDHVTEQDGDIRKDLGRRSNTGSYNKYTLSKHKYSFAPWLLVFSYWQTSSPVRGDVVLLHFPFLSWFVVMSFCL